MDKPLPGLTLVIPTYRREQVLLDTIRRMHDLDPAPDEILIVDQTERHEPATEEALQHLHDEGWINWIRLPEPSIPHAMNVGLLESRHEIVLFTDDDVVPNRRLVAAHAAAQREEGVGIVAGAVIQPWEKAGAGRTPGSSAGFASGPKHRLNQFMGGNFSIRRDLALALGGFDENFVRAAYRFEREFAERILTAGRLILAAPEAVLEHLQAGEGGTRSFGDFRRTIRPGHAVGEYYWLLRSRVEPRRFLQVLRRPFRSVLTRYHLRHPWWIPVTFMAEVAGLFWAVLLALKGPRLLAAPAGGR